METQKRSRFKLDPSLRLMNQLRQVLRYHHYAYRTEQTYCNWIVRFIRFLGAKIHPAQMGKPHIEAFLSHLATRGEASAATQRQDLNAIVFLYRHVLDQDIQEAKGAKNRTTVLPQAVQSELRLHLEKVKDLHV